MSHFDTQDTTEWVNYYLCPCGEHWTDSHDCCCNDRCPRCNREIEPYISDDGWVPDTAIDEALRSAAKTMNLIENDDGLFTQA